MKIGTGTLVAAGVSAALLVTGMAVGIGAQISSQACERQAAKFATAYTWDLGVGCYIETEPGKWAPAEKL